MLNAVGIVGRLYSEIEFEKNRQGKIEGRFVLEVKNPFKSEIGKDEYEYIHVVAWRGVAEMLHDCSKIGSMIAIKGRIGTQIIEIGEQEIHSAEIIAEYVEILDKHFQK